MRRLVLWLSLALSLSVGAVCQAASTPIAGTNIRATDRGNKAYRLDLESARSAYDKRDFDNACRLYQRLVADRQASRLSPPERRALYSGAGLAMRQCDRPALALKYLQRATREVADPFDYFYLALVADEAGRHALAREVYIEYIQRWPEAADESDTELVWSLYRASSGRPDEQRRLLQAMFDADFEDPVANTSPLWFELVRLHLDRGDLDRARQTAQRVTALDSIIRMRVDRRFDPIMDHASGTFDAMQLAERAIEIQLKKVDARPDDLAAWVELTYALLDADRNDDVIAIATSLLDASDPDKPRNEKDPEFIKLDMRLWLMNNRALALYREGRLREAVEDLQRAVRSTTGDQINVSQTLNLGVMTCRAGYPQQAIEAVRTVGQMSDYGKIVLAMVHLCAAKQLKDPAGVESALDRVRAHASEHPSALIDALVWAERLDEAEQLYLRLLDDPEDRADALLAAQTFVAADHLPVVQARQQTWQALLARPAVREAIERVGRVESFPIRSGHDYD